MPAAVPEIVSRAPAGPLVRFRTRTGDHMWLVRDQAAARQLLSDPRFSRAAAAKPDVPTLNTANPAPDSIMSRDGQEHRRLRRLVAGWFSPRQLSTLTHFVEQTAEELAADVAAQGAPVDLISSYATPLPLTILTELLGIPANDRGQFGAYVDVLFDIEASHQIEKRRRGVALAGYMASLVGRLRADPTPGVLSDLVAVHDRGGLTRSELINLGLALLTAGYQTTAAQIGMSVSALLQDPVLRDAMGDARCRPGAIEEILRLMPATPLSFSRVAMEPVRLAGVRIEAGEAVIVSILDANRDTSSLDDPHQLNLEGQTSPHLTFGFGPHYCVGAPLARLQVSTAVEVLLRHFPTLHLAGSEALSWKNGLGTCELARIMVSW
jgi:cytochrome P450